MLTQSEINRPNLVIGRVCKSTRKIQVYEMHGGMYDAITQSVDQCDIRSGEETSVLYEKSNITREAGE